MPIRTAVLGFGLAGRIFHCPFLSAVPGLELTAIVQRHGSEAAAAYPHARILRSVEEAFSDPSLELLVIATPNATHAELARRALLAGKHVVVDKPLAPTSTEVHALISLARKQNRLLAPFHNRRWDGDFLTLRQLLDTGRLGRLISLRSRFDRFRPAPKPHSWKEVAGNAQGLLQDLGPHLLDQALALFGPPGHLTASIRRDRDQTDIDDAWDILLEYRRDGHTLRVELGATMLTPEPSPRFAAHGTLGSFLKHGVDPQEPAMVRENARPPHLDDPKPWLSDPPEAWGQLTTYLSSDPVRQPIPTLPGDYRLFYSNLRDAVLGLAPLTIPPETALAVARLAELAHQSSRERRTLDVPPD